MCKTKCFVYHLQSGYLVMMMMRMKQMIKMVTWVKDGNGENDDMGKNGGRLLEARTQLVLTLMATGHWQQ